MEYLPVVLAVIFLNTADIYFLQDESNPPLHRSPSFWLYLAGQILVSLFASYLLYERIGLMPTEWPIVTAVASLLSFSVIQSFTFKFGDKGIDARELFDAWKRRVISDISRTNASRKRARINKVARELAKKAGSDTEVLELAIHQIAPAAHLKAVDVIGEIKASGQQTQYMMAQWIAMADLEFAENLLK